METLAYLYFTESYEESDLATRDVEEPPNQPPKLPDQTPGPTHYAENQQSSMPSTGYDPKLETQPNWMML